MTTTHLNAHNLHTADATSIGVSIADKASAVIDLHLDGGAGGSWGSAQVSLQISIDGGQTWNTPSAAPVWSAPGVKYVAFTNCQLRLITTVASGGTADFAQAIVRVSFGALSLGKDDAHPAALLNTALGLKLSAAYGARAVRIRGHDDAVSSTISLLSPKSSGLYTFPSAAETVRVKAGGDANDTAAGAGARTVVVEGLDANGAEISETIDLAGASASSATAAEFIRVNSFYVATAGTYHTTANSGSNAAAITLEGVSSSIELSYIATQDGESAQALYSIPAGWDGYIVSIMAQANVQPISAEVLTRADLLDSTAPVAPRRQVYRAVRLRYDHVDFTLHNPIKLDPLTDIWCEADGYSASTGALGMEIGLILLPAGTTL